MVAVSKRRLSDEWHICTQLVESYGYSFDESKAGRIHSALWMERFNPWWYGTPGVPHGLMLPCETLGL